MANFLVWCVWFAATFFCLASAIAVVSFRNPFFSALALIGNLASLAVLYLLLGGEFVAAAQVLVYGGAVMVMFLFVIAYLGDRTDRESWAGEPTVTVLVAAAILLEVVFAISNKAGGSLAHPATITSSFGSPESIGRLFLTDHLLAFEVTSIILLVAAVGGVVLGSHARIADQPGEEA
jgi:NADH-quinone oxidoreductase subunit J